MQNQAAWQALWYEQKLFRDQTLAARGRSVISPR
jgi:hypothetical protein